MDALAFRILGRHLAPRSLASPPRSNGLVVASVPLETCPTHLSHLRTPHKNTTGKLQRRGHVLGVVAGILDALVSVYCPAAVCPLHIIKSAFSNFLRTPWHYFIHASHGNDSGIVSHTLPPPFLSPTKGRALFPRSHRESLKSTRHTKP